MSPVTPPWKMMMTVETRSIGPLTFSFNTELRDEVLVSTTAQDEGRFGRVLISHSLTPDEVRRIAAYCQSLDRTHIMDSDFGEKVERFTFVECERV